MSKPNFHPGFLIETLRLYITHFDPDSATHCDFLVALYNSPEFIASHDGRPTSTTTREIASEQIRTKFREEHERNGYGKYLISLKPTPAPTDLKTGFAEVLRGCELVGMVTLMKGAGPNAFAVPDIGFVIHPSKMQQGYAKEAGNAILAMAETFLGVKEVVGMCDEDNEASKATLRSLGFENRGVLEVKAFGGRKGMVWAKPGMAEDLSVYGF